MCQQGWIAAKVGIAVHGSFRWRQCALHLGQLSLAFRGVAKSSISFGWGKGQNVISAGWQLTMFDPTRVSVAVRLVANCYTPFTLPYLTIQYRYIAPWGQNETAPKRILIGLAVFTGLIGVPDTQRDRQTDAQTVTRQTCVAICMRCGQISTLQKDI